MAMNSLETETGLKQMGWGSAQHLHAAIESMRLGFVDTLQYNADPQVWPCFLPIASWTTGLWVHPCDPEHVELMTHQLPTSADGGHMCIEVYSI